MDYALVDLTDEVAQALATNSSNDVIISAVDNEASQRIGIVMARLSNDTALVKTKPVVFAVKQEPVVDPDDVEQISMVVVIAVSVGCILAAVIVTAVIQTRKANSTGRVASLKIAGMEAENQKLQGKVDAANSRYDNAKLKLEATTGEAGAIQAVFGGFEVAPRFFWFQNRFFFYILLLTRHHRPT